MLLQKCFDPIALTCAMYKDGAIYKICDFELSCIEVSVVFLIARPLGIRTIPVSKLVESQNSFSNMNSHTSQLW